MASVRLLVLIKRGDLVVAKTDPPLLSVPVAVIVFLRRAKLLNWLQDLFPEVAIALNVRAFKGPWSRILFWLRNKSLRYAQANVAVGQKMAVALRKQGVRPERISVIPNWAIHQEIRPIASHDNPLRQEWGFEGAFVVGYSGNLGRAHDIDTLVEVLVSSDMDGASQFLFIGGGYYYDVLRERTQELGLNNCHFRPYQARSILCESLNVPDVHLVFLRPELEGFVVPSKFYGIAAAGKPTINVGDPEGEIGRLVCENQCGISVAAGDKGGLAEAINLYVSDPSLRLRHGDNARGLFERRYNSEYSKQAWSELLGRVVLNEHEQEINHQGKTPFA